PNRSTWNDADSCPTKRTGRTSPMASGIDRLLCPLRSFPNFDAENFAVEIINARIRSRVQHAFVRDRVVVGGRSVEIVHLKFFSVYADDVAFAVTGLRLLMKHFNRSLHDFVLFIVVGVHQFIDVTKYVWKKMHINPE